LMFVYREDKPIANCIPNKKKWKLYENGKMRHVEIIPGIGA
jgi:hypothetical protein